MKLIILFCLLLLCSLTTFADQVIIEPDDGYPPFLTAIANAHHTIDLAIYGFTDFHLAQALVQAKNRGITVRVLLEPTPYQRNDENTFIKNRLQNAGIVWRATPKTFKLSHEKLMLIDGATAWVMTMNFTHASFSKERNLALISHDPRKVQALMTLFDADWHAQSMPLTELPLIISPDNSDKILLSLLQKARSRIDIYAQHISDYAIVGALHAAAMRGVSIRIITTQSAADEAPPLTDGTKRYLTQAGVMIHYHPTLMVHAKMINIDNQCAVIGSINLTHASLTQNREISVQSCDPEIQLRLQQLFTRDWG